MVLCLEGSVVFTPHGKNQCRNPENITNVLICRVHRLGDARLNPQTTKMHVF